MRAGWLVCAWLVALVLSGCGGESSTGNELPVHCLDRPEAGPCKGRVPGYYYDYRLNRCRTFHYGGCQGHVPFDTLESCEDSCVAE